MIAAPGEVTQLLHELSQGNKDAEGLLITLGFAGSEPI